MKVEHIFSGRTHKEKENIKDCQDAFSFSEKSFAISDGASQSFYSSIWADLLVKHYCENPSVDKINWKDWLKPIQETWLSEIKNRVENAKKEGKPSWIDNQNRLNRFEPATATFIGIHFIENLADIVLVGDSCLLIVQNEKIIDSLPFKKSAEFNDAPEYLASYSKDNKFLPKFISANFEGKQTDNLYFILATDALAEWILKNKESDNDITPILLGLSSQADFEEFVNSARQSKKVQMKNDDVTLLIIKINGKERSSNKTIPTNQKQDDTVTSNPQINFNISSKNEQKPETERQKDKFEKKKLPDNQVTEIDKLKKENLFLKVGLGISLLFLVVICIQIQSVFNELKKEQILKNQNPKTTAKETAVIKTEPKKVEPKPIVLARSVIIYSKDKNAQLSQPLKSDHKALLIDEKDDWQEFEIELFAHKSLITSCSPCESDEIEIKPIVIIRTSKSAKQNKNVFEQ